MEPTKNWPYIQKKLTSMDLTSGLHCIKKRFWIKSRTIHVQIPLSLGVQTQRCGHRCELNSRPLPSSTLSGTICSLDIWQTVSIIAKGNFPDIDCSKLFIQIKQWMMEAEKTFYVSVGHQNEPWNARHVVFSHSVLSLLMRLDYQNQASKLQNIVLPRQRKLISWSQWG